MTENNSTLYAQIRPLPGNVNRDFFGGNKRSWTLQYKNLKPTDYAMLKATYDRYLSDGQTITWRVTGDHYSVAQVLVHVDMPVRVFDTRGNSYISDVDLTLTEA